MIGAMAADLEGRTVTFAIGDKVFRGEFPYFFGGQIIDFASDTLALVIWWVGSVNGKPVVEDISRLQKTGWGVTCG